MTTKALYLCIKKYTDMIRDHKDYLDINLSPSDCALCEEYFEKDCRGCVIAGKDLKHAVCGGTPYTDMLAAQEENNEEAFWESAQQELTMLQGLWPVLIDGEQSYPIYQFNFKWVEDGEHDVKYPRLHEGLPEGRIHDSTSYCRMYKDEQSGAALEKEAQEWWLKYKDSEKRKDKNPADMSYDAEYLRHETWCEAWFEHWTFDTGQTDEETLRSFGKFVERMRTLDSYCLMGAEDRWRWHGADDDGKPDTRTDPPCRCKFCKAQGKLRIGH